MSKDHFNAVRKSDLYEYCGISKPLLTQIAGLIIGFPKNEDEEPDEYAGWCIARQDVLAAMVGCSPEEVSRQTSRFKQAGWLTIRKFRDKRGYPRCHYAITAEQLAKIKAREMKKDDDGHYIRAKMPKKSRRGVEASQENLKNTKKLAHVQRRFNVGSTNVESEPTDKLSVGSLTGSQQGTCESVSTPPDDLSLSVVAVVVPSVGVSNRRLKTNPKETPPLLLPKEGMNKQQPPPVRAPGGALHIQTSNPVTLLEFEVRKTLVDAGYCEQLLAEVARLKNYCSALNNTSNPVTALQSLLGKDNGTAKKLTKMQSKPGLRAHPGRYVVGAGNTPHSTEILDFEDGDFWDDDYMPKPKHRVTD